MQYVIPIDKEGRALRAPAKVIRQMLRYHEQPGKSSPNLQQAADCLLALQLPLSPAERTGLDLLLERRLTRAYQEVSR